MNLDKSQFTGAIDGANNVVLSAKGVFKNYVDQRGWVGGSPNVNCSNKPYLVKASTRGR